MVPLVTLTRRPLLLNPYLSFYVITPATSPCSIPLQPSLSLCLYFCPLPPLHRCSMPTSIDRPLTPIPANPPSVSSFRLTITTIIAQLAARSFFLLEQPSMFEAFQQKTTYFWPKPSLLYTFPNRFSHHLTIPGGLMSPYTYIKRSTLYILTFAPITCAYLFCYLHNFHCITIKLIYISVHRSNLNHYVYNFFFRFIYLRPIWLVVFHSVDRLKRPTLHLFVIQPTKNHP